MYLHLFYVKVTCEMQMSQQSTQLPELMMKWNATAQTAANQKAAYKTGAITVKLESPNFNTTVNCFSSNLMCWITDETKLCY